MKIRHIATLLAAVFTAAAPAQQMNYQGRLTDNAGAPQLGSEVTLTFSMWTLPSGGAKVWGDFQLNADLIDGRFSVKLGDATGDDGNGTLLSTAFATNPGFRYLEVKVGNDAPLPRQQVLPAPTALHAVRATTADAVIANGITTSQIANNQITTAKIGDGQITGNKIQDGSIPVSKLTGAGASFWDGNGTSVWRPTGNVGIGTSTPTHKLDVAGDVRGSFIVRPNGTYTSGSIFSDSNYGMIFRSATLNPANAEFVWANATDNHLMTMKSNGDVIVPGTVNGESPPYRFEMGTDTGAALSRVVESSIMEKYMGDGDGCRIRYLFRRDSNDELFVGDQVLYCEPRGIGSNLEAGFRGNTWIIEASDLQWILDTPNKYKLSYGGAAVNVYNYDLGGTGAVYGEYELKFICTAGWSATVIIYDN